MRNNWAESDRIHLFMICCYNERNLIEKARSESKENSRELSMGKSCNVNPGTRQAGSPSVLLVPLLGGEQPGQAQGGSVESRLKETCHCEHK